MSKSDFDWRARILADPKIHHGDPCIRGTRVAVSILVGSLVDMTREELLAAYPQITSDDLDAAIIYAAKAAHKPLVA